MTEFIVSVTDPMYPSEPVTSAALRSSLLYGSSGWGNVEVRKYDPESEVRTSKIGAIKRIRALLGCSLVDAKFLADVAEEKGSAKFFGVQVEFDSTGFRVIENR